MTGVEVQTGEAGVRTAALAAGAAATGAAALLMALVRGDGLGGAISAASGACLALLTLAGTSLAALRSSRRGPLAVWRVSVLGVVVRMAFIGAAIALVATRAWFEPFHFVGAFGGLYLVLGAWIVVRQSREMQGQSEPAVDPDGRGGRSACGPLPPPRA